MFPVTTFRWDERTLLTASERAAAKARAEWAGFRFCRAARDGECIDKRCPNADGKCPGGGCPLPMHERDGSVTPGLFDDGQDEAI